MQIKINLIGNEYESFFYVFMLIAFPMKPENRDAYFMKKTALIDFNSINTQFESNLNAIL